MAARFIYEGKSAREKRISRLATMSRVKKMLPIAAAGWQATGGSVNEIIFKRLLRICFRGSASIGVLMKSDKKRRELLISVTAVTAL